MEAPRTPALDRTGAMDGPGAPDRTGAMDRPEWCTTPDGVRIAAYDLGGEGPDLLLAHATGFCAGVLVPLATALSGTFHCWALDLRGHGRSGRPADGTYDWAGFGSDVLTVVDHLGLDRPVGFGHSCGGASVLMAEQRRPGTFTSLYCFEPVVIPVPAGQEVPAMDDNPLSAGARRRRETFPSAGDAFATFSAKPPFQVLDPDALRGYVETGFEVVPADEGGDGRTIRLRCRRQDEAAIYARGPANGVFAELGSVSCPVHLACGDQTDAFGPPALEALAARLPEATVEVFTGLGHFGPLEDPPAVAGSIVRAVGPAASPRGGTPSP